MENRRAITSLEVKEQFISTLEEILTQYETQTFDLEKIKVQISKLKGLISNFNTRYSTQNMLLDHIIKKLEQYQNNPAFYYVAFNAITKDIYNSIFPD